MRTIFDKTPNDLSRRGIYKTNALYNKKISGAFIARTLICYIVAFVLLYVLAAWTPYIGTVKVSDEFFQKYNIERFTEYHGGQRALFMPTSEESFFRRLVLVKNAQESIDFTVHTVSTDDDGAHYFFGALLEAAERGVHIRIIIDGKMGHMGSGEYLNIRKIFASYDNVEYYDYNVFNFFDSGSLNRVLHDKILNVDSQYTIVGGANTGFKDYINNIDAEVLITRESRGESVGDASRQASEYFDSLIESGMLTKRTGNYSNDKLKARYINEFNDYYNNSTFDKSTDFSAAVPIDNVTLVHNPIGGTKGAGQIFETYLNLIKHSAAARLYSPYISYEPKNNQKIREAAQGREVELFTNSLYNTPNIAYSVYRLARPQLLSEDIVLREYQGDRQVHAKLMTCDNNITVVGSFNLDERSAFLDTETVAIVCGKEFNASVNRFFDELTKASVRVTKENVYDPESEVKPKPVPPSKRFLFALMGVASYPFVNLL